MAKVTGAALTLLLILTINLFTLDEAAYGCCTHYSKRQLNINRFCGFSIQNMTTTCDIDAIIFHTCKGRKLCANPTESWVMTIINKLKDKVETMKHYKHQRRG